MEHMEGSLRKKKFASGDLLQIVAGICRALKCFRSINLFYTDLKPDNLLYRCENGHYHIYFADYGSASSDKGTSVFTMVPFQAWPDEFYKAYPFGFNPGLFQSKEWHLVFLLFPMACLLWDEFSSSDKSIFYYTRFYNQATGALISPQHALQYDQNIEQEFDRYLLDAPFYPAEMRRLFHIMRACMHAKSNHFTLDGVLEEIEKVKTLYV